MSGDIADDQDDMTIVYMLGFERGKDAAAATITAQAQEIERLRKALDTIKRLKPEPIAGSGFVTGPLALLNVAQRLAREATSHRARAAIRKETTTC